VNIFDISQAEEDDALYQVINHGSAIAHAGFMYPSTDIYALGTDETMSFYALQSQKEEEEEPTPKSFGDVREPLGCEYIAKMHWVGSQPFIVAGKHRCVNLWQDIIHVLTIRSENRLDLVPVHKGADVLQYDFDITKSVRFPSAHGDEIVRDLFTDTHVRRLDITLVCLLTRG
jgi:hypothetical protein